MLTIALSKGRILDDTLPLLAEAGIVPTENPDKSRKLIIPTTQDDVRLLIVRATDVPTYVEHGAADLGVAGKDVLMASLVAPIMIGGQFKGTASADFMLPRLSTILADLKSIFGL